MPSKALGPVATALLDLVTALRERAADLGVLEIDAPASGEYARDKINEKYER